MFQIVNRNNIFNIAYLCSHYFREKIVSVACYSLTISWHMAIEIRNLPFVKMFLDGINLEFAKTKISRIQNMFWRNSKADDINKVDFFSAQSCICDSL